MTLAQQICEAQYGAAFARADRRRQLALMSMAFNLGAPRLGGFRRMRAAIQSGDWHQAAREGETLVREVLEDVGALKYMEDTAKA